MRVLKPARKDWLNEHRRHLLIGSEVIPESLRKRLCGRLSVRPAKVRWATCRKETYRIPDYRSTGISKLKLNTTKPETILKDYKIHPATNLFPLMSGDELKELVEDIRTHGLRKPIVMFDGQVLDGRNRIIACEQAGVAPYFESLFSCPSPTNYAISLNLRRRHLTPSQRAGASTESIELFKAEAKAAQRAHGGTAPGKKKNTSDNIDISVPASQRTARAKAAKAFGVSEGYIQDAQQIKEKSPDTFEKVRSGEMSMSEAKKQIWDAGAIANRPKEQPNFWRVKFLWSYYLLYRRSSKRGSGGRVVAGHQAKAEKKFDSKNEWEPAASQHWPPSSCRADRAR